jgi:predicted dehydrogenase
VGFLGLGWIGRHRMEALVAANTCHVVALADASPDAVRSAMTLVPGAKAAQSIDDLLAMDLDGAVIATPSALHAQQALALLESGVAVFCQKPLARTAQETAAIIDAARKSDRLLACDYSYRHTEGMRRIRDSIAAGELGTVYAVDMVFHNAYGPDKAWFRDAALSGGGCVIDLGIHLVDLALWTLGFPTVERVSSKLYAQGRPLTLPSPEVEDYAVAQLELSNGAVVRIACSWNLAAGQDAVIEARFHGSRGGAALRNRDGSFYDFIAERYEGTRRVTLVEPPDDWGGRAAVEWARRLATGERFDPHAGELGAVAAAIDRIYAGA